MTNSDFFTTVYAPYQQTNMTQGTARVRMNIIKKYLLEKYGAESPADIAAVHINGIYDDMENAGLAQNTIYGTAQALRSFFKMAIEYGDAQNNPVVDARIIRQEHT